MLNILVGALGMIVFFAILAFGMKWVCDTFFKEFRPAYWICGVILLIMLLIAFSWLINGGLTSGTAALPWHH